MTKFSSVFLCLLLLSSIGFADAETAGQAPPKLEARAFQFKHKDAEKAALLIKSLISAEGSLSIQPSSNTLVVTDYSANLKSIATAIEKFDSPPKSFKISLQLVGAWRSPIETKIPDELKPISAKLSGVLRFNSFEKLGDIVAEGKEGDPVLFDLGKEYRAEFKFGEYDPLSDSIRLTDFKLGRLQPATSEGSQIQSLLKTSLNLKVGQTVILGASRVPQSNRALMLVLIAKRAVSEQ